jgi:GNAT superfamily N-acetyltransferase
MEIVLCSEENNGYKWIFEMAKNEGWEPGLSDLDIYRHIDPNGIFLGMIDGEIIGCITGIKFNEEYGFIGYYIVHPHYRGQGYGITLWRHAIHYLGERNIGLDGVLAQVPNYQKSGFNITHQSQRYKGVSSSSSNQILSLSHNILPIQTVDDLNALNEFDQKYFPAKREIWLQHYHDLPSLVTAIYFDEAQQILGYGVLRPSVAGYRFGPLYATNLDVTLHLFHYLTSQLRPNSSFFIDIPSCNSASVSFIEQSGLEYQWECARMYTKALPGVDWNGIFGLSSLELG